MPWVWAPGPSSEGCSAGRCTYQDKVVVLGFHLQLDALDQEDLLCPQRGGDALWKDRCWRLSCTPVPLGRVARGPPLLPVPGRSAEHPTPLTHSSSPVRSLQRHQTPSTSPGVSIRLKAFTRSPLRTAIPLGGIFFVGLSPRRLCCLGYAPEGTKESKNEPFRSPSSPGTHPGGGGKQGCGDLLLLTKASTSGAAAAAAPPDLHKLLF